MKFLHLKYILLIIFLQFFSFSYATNFFKDEFETIPYQRKKLLIKQNLSNKGKNPKFSLCLMSEEKNTQINNYHSAFNNSSPKTILTFFENLPNEINFHILKFLSLKSLGYMEQVSFYFRHLLKSHDIWIFNLRQIGIINTINPKKNCIINKNDINIRKEALQDKLIISRLSTQHQSLLKILKLSKKNIGFAEKFLSSSVVFSRIHIHYLEALENHSLVKNEVGKAERRLNIAVGKYDLNLYKN